jgi:hypothetical protein
MSITEVVALELKQRNLLPANVNAIWIGGSLARGWGHQRSDADVFIVSPGTWVSSSDEYQSVRVSPNTVPIEAIHVNGQRWEIRYWQETQIEQLIDRVSWDSFEAGKLSLNLVETSCLARLVHALPVTGIDWIMEKREYITGSALRTSLFVDALARAEMNVEDIVGLLGSGDMNSAVLSGQAALTHIVDALTASLGEYGSEWKWRAKRMQALNPAVLPFDDYWELVTMRSFDPTQPEAWVRRIIDIYRRVSAEVAVD